MIKITPLILLLSCTSISSWKLDHISSQNSKFETSRLSYQNIGSRSPIRLEFFNMAGSIDLIISLTRYEITASSDKASLVTLQIDEETFEEVSPIYEGNMRLHLSKKSTKKIVEALLSGRSVKISFDDMQENIDPEKFSKYYEKLSGNTMFLETFLEDFLQ